MRKVIIDDLPYKKISLGVCTECNTEKFHCINDDGSIDFITLCECEVAKENKEPSKVSSEVEGDFSSAEVDSGVDQENKPTKTKDLVILNAFIYGFVALMLILIIIFFIV